MTSGKPNIDGIDYEKCREIMRFKPFGNHNFDNSTGQKKPELCQVSHFVNKISSWVGEELLCSVKALLEYYVIKTTNLFNKA